jgi:hypothetical protein
LNARTYYVGLLDAIHAAPHVIASEIRFEDIDVNECYVRGILTLLEGFALHIAEYIITEPVLNRVKYRYHLQTANGQLICRWDNVPHHPNIATFPYHRHDNDGYVYPSPAMSIPDVLDAALSFILPTP